MPEGRRALFALWLLASAHGSPRDPTVLPPPPSAHAAPGVAFEDVTSSAGLGSFEHRAGSPDKPYLPETIGSGVALFDYDNDGWLDAYLLSSLSEEARRGIARPNPSVLFRNNRDGTFTDVTAQAGVANERWGVGTCAGDVNNDGWTDLFVTNFGKSRLYLNGGDGTFEDTAAEAGVQVDAWSTGCAFGDYDADGLLDLYVASYVDFRWDDPPPPGAPPGSCQRRVARQRIRPAASLRPAPPTAPACRSACTSGCPSRAVPRACPRKPTRFFATKATADSATSPGNRA